MNVFFQLTDLSSGNVIQDFDTEHEALRAIRHVWQEHGGDAVAPLALLRFEDGHPTLVAMDEELVARAKAWVLTGGRSRGVAD